ncbi:MAG: caspase family protein [Planctomycetales bacterium]|nr:caspase family protein [Planctomycetales bacterium]
MTRKERIRIALLALSSAIATLTMPLHGQTFRKHVIAIGVPDPTIHGQESPTVNSAELFVRSLGIHAAVCQAQGHPIVTLTGQRSLTDQSPTKAAILTSLKDLLRDVMPQDEVWFYFCGHGLIANGESCLVPQDGLADLRKGITSPSNLLSIRSIESELAKCPAQRKVMILDCCQTDYTELLSPDWSPSNQGQNWLAEVQNSSVELLSSCDQGQVSLLWPSKNVALYTWWLCHGLKGAADENRDGRLSLHELSSFAAARVGQSMTVVKSEICRRANIAPQRAPARLFVQTPYYRETAGKLQHNPAFVISETNFDQSMAALAELTNDLALLESATWKLSSPPTVAVGEFIETKGNQEELRGENGLFGKLAADRLTKKLLQVRSDRYVVMDPNEVAASLLDIGIRARHDPQSWKKAASNYFLDTTFVVERERGRVHLTSSLFDTESGKQLNSMTSLIKVNHEVEDILGSAVSWAVRETTAPPSVVTASASGPSQDTRHSDDKSIVEPVEPARPRPNLKLAVMRRAAGKNHSMLVSTNAAKPSPERPVSTSQGPVSVNAGDELELILENLESHPIAVVPILDGTSLLEMQSGLTPQECVQRGLYFIMQPRATNGFTGWLHRSSKINEQKQAGYDVFPFRVVDAPQSVAAQNSYGKDFGEIRILVYPVQPAAAISRGASEALGIGLGEKKAINLNVEDKWIADTKNGGEIYTIRYVSAQKP